MKKSNIALGVGIGVGAILLLALSGGRKSSVPHVPGPIPSPVPTPPEGSVAGLARQEAVRWAGVTESSPEGQERLRVYWAATGQAYPGSETAWSGAFVTWVIRNSRIPNALLPTGAHIYYARQAYLDRGVPGKYGAYRPEEVAVEPGDILLRGRAGEPFSFSDLQQSTRDFIPTHGDIVTEVVGSEARIVGGNVGNAVSERSIPLNGGVVADPRVIAVLRYQPDFRAV